MPTPLIIEAREKHINAVIRRANFEEIEIGRNWYPVAHDFAIEIAGGDLEKGAGVVAALSPQNGWSDNKRIAQRAFDQGFGSGHTKDACGKVNRILSGEHPLNVLGGDKVRSFYRNIVNPECPETVTVDRHAVSVAIGRISTSKDTAVLGRKGVYAAFSKCYIASARRFGMAPAEIQAITWTRLRNEKGITW